METPAGRTAKDALFTAFASFAKALGSGRRAEIVDVLAQGERSVDELAREIGQSVANTSQHLQLLTGAGLLRSHREGNRVFYRLASERVGELWSALRDAAAEHVADVNALAADYLGDRERVELVTAEDLAARLSEGRVVVLDVRPRREYEAGHIAGAASAPLSTLHTVVDGLDRSREVVAYCRGPYCVYADDAVRMLQDRGFAARRLDTGFPEWRRTGLPVVAPTR